MPELLSQKNIYIKSTDKVDILWSLYLEACSIWDVAKNLIFKGRQVSQFQSEV